MTTQSFDLTFLCMEVTLIGSIMKERVPAISPSHRGKVASQRNSQLWSSLLSPYPTSSPSACFSSGLIDRTGRPRRPNLAHSSWSINFHTRHLIRYRLAAKNQSSDTKFNMSISDPPHVRASPLNNNRLGFFPSIPPQSSLPFATRQPHHFHHSIPQNQLVFINLP